MFTSGMGHLLLYECKDNQKLKLSNMFRFYKALKRLWCLYFFHHSWVVGLYMLPIFIKVTSHEHLDRIVSKYGTNIYLDSLFLLNLPIYVVLPLNAYQVQ